jgi:hypothetical protein
MKGPTMGRVSPFHDFAYDHFDIEAQGLELGIGPDDFQVVAPLGGKLDLLRLRHGSLDRERISLDDNRIQTDNQSVLSNGILYSFEGTGAGAYNGLGRHEIWYQSLGTSTRAQFPLVSQVDGSVVVLLDRVGYKIGDEADDYLELRRYYPNRKAFDTLLVLPRTGSWGDMVLHQLHEGFLDVRSWMFDSEDTVKEIAHYYTYEGKPAPHPLAHALNLLHSQGIDLNTEILLPRVGAFYPSRTRDMWGLFVWNKFPQYPGKNLFLLSVTDTVQGLPVTCDRMSLDPSRSLEQVLIHPARNVFLVVARYASQDEVADSVQIYLGRVRKDSTGKVYQAQTYCVGSFPEVQHAILSRDGETFAFAMRIGEQTHLVMAHMTDLAAEVNRRYPEAKFDLEEQK